MRRNHYDESNHFSGSCVYLKKHSSRKKNKAKFYRSVMKKSSKINKNTSMNNIK